MSDLKKTVPEYAIKAKLQKRGQEGGTGPVLEKTSMSRKNMREKQKVVTTKKKKEGGHMSRE